MRTKAKDSFSYRNPLIDRFGEQYFKDLPKVPGVYFMLDVTGSILYIGKAKCLRSRLRQYAGFKPGNAPERLLELVENVARIEWNEHETEKQALARESELLHAIRPPFNIAQTEEEFY